MRLRSTLLFLCLICGMFSSNAQELPYSDGELLNYDIRYKYGIVMLKAGSATYQVSAAQYKGKPVYLTDLRFRTSSFFDKIYKVRDTLNSYVATDHPIPLYHKRYIHEGNTHFFEEVFMKKQSPTSEVRVRRENVEKVKFDTTLTSNHPGFDILSIFAYARTLDFANMQIGQSFPLTTFVGKRKVDMVVRYMGQSVYEKSEIIKYNALRIEVDIVDEVFNESKNAMEIWVSNDKNRVPLKLKAKLKIGAAEAELSSYKNLKHPLTSEIRLKR